MKGTFNLIATIIKGRINTAGALFDTFSTKINQFMNRLQIMGNQVLLLKAQATFDESEAIKLRAQITGLKNANEDLERTYKKTSAARRIAARKNAIDERKSLEDLQKSYKEFAAFYEQLGKKLNPGPSSGGFFGNAISSAVKTVLSGVNSLKGNSVEDDLATDRSAATQRALEQERLAAQRQWLKDDEKFYAEQLRLQEEADKEAIRLQKLAGAGNQAAIREVSQRSRGTLRESLSSAFRGGISDAAPAFRTALSSTLSASAQPGVSFRGSTLQAGQGTRQQLQDSLFNREATGRQLATNIQLLAAGFATGGTVPGADQGRDSMLVPLRGQEEVIRPEAAGPNRGLLKMINASRGPIVLPSRGESLSFPGQAIDGASVFNNSNSSSVNNSRTTNDNRQQVNIRSVNVQGQGDANQIANAVIKQIEYKARRGLLKMGAI